MTETPKEASKLGQFSWALFDWANQPFFTIVTTFIFAPYFANVMVGDPIKDKDLLTAMSPALNADRIKTPLLIAQGARDPRVNIDESNQMVKALKARGVDVPYMVKENEGHGFRNEENQFDFYEAMERFLAKYLSKG